jgi:uncharacterized FAD-dependent dehydrogenase
MILENVQLILTPEEAKNDLVIKNKLVELTKIPENKIQFRWKKRSIDARKREIKIQSTFLVSSEPFDTSINEVIQLKNASNSPSVAIIGFGPAGIFAALKLLELGIKPIIFERGKDVRSRRRDLARLNKEMLVNPESNYCFGEGGAGTYSDGKLYTRSKKRGDVETVLKTFVQFGASEDILIDAHPHIGTNKLPNIIVSMREAIIKAGGEVHFDSKLTDIHVENNSLKSIEINKQKIYSFNQLILATGHSARDIFYLLHAKKIKINAKPFALGVRIEHSQEIIDKIQYHGRVNDEYLPPASYSLVTQINDKGVFSFCMCPGGIVAPCATDSDEVVTNGWSPSKRNNPYSNSGIVVSVEPKDLPGDQNNPFICLDFQKEIERKAWILAGKTQKVPAQRLIDFVNNKKSQNLPKSSYQPGIVSVNLSELFPSFVLDRLRKGFIDFGKKMNGFLTNDAILHAPESRTSSPISIPRNPENCEHIQIKGIYPCGEGAGYAGGIVSAAIDGMKCAEKLTESLFSKK